jgi:hypothetical protein
MYSPLPLSPVHLRFPFFSGSAVVPLACGCVHFQRSPALFSYLSLCRCCRNEMTTANCGEKRLPQPVHGSFNRPMRGKKEDSAAEMECRGGSCQQAFNCFFLQTAKIATVGSSGRVNGEEAPTEGQGKETKIPRPKGEKLTRRIINKCRNAVCRRRNISLIPGRVR